MNQCPNILDLKSVMHHYVKGIDALDRGILLDPYLHMMNTIFLHGMIVLTVCLYNTVNMATRFFLHGILNMTMFLHGIIIMTVLLHNMVNSATRIFLHGILNVPMFLHVLVDVTICLHSMMNKATLSLCGITNSIMFLHGMMNNTA